MLALVFKDLRYIFFRVEIYLCFGIILLLAGFFFFSNLHSYNTLVALQSSLAPQDLKNLSLESQVLNYYWFSADIIGIFSASFLAIKLLDEERRAKMLDRIVRVIGVTRLLTAKVITVTILNLIQTALFLVLPIILSITNVVWTPQIWTAAIGTFFSLTIYSFTAILIASFTTGIWLTSLASICIVLVSYFFYTLALKSGPFLAEIFRFLSILTHQQKFISGLVSLQSILLGLFIIASMFAVSVFVNKRNSRI